MASSKDNQPEEIMQQEPKKIKHPSFSIRKEGDTIMTTLTLSDYHTPQLEEVYILHRETGQRYSFLAEKKDKATYTFSVGIRDFIRQHAPKNPKEHFEFYYTVLYLEENEWVRKDEPLSLDLFEQFDSFGLSQFKDQGNDIYPYFSRKTRGFCFTINIPVRSIRYIHSSQIKQIEPKKDFLTIVGELVTTAIAVNRIDTIMVGRKTGTRRTIHSNHHLNRLEVGTHHYYYDYDILVDLNDLAKELFVHNSGDEDFDFYLEVYLNGLFDPTIVRVANPQDLSSRKFYKDQAISYGKSAYLFSPNFTEHYNGLSLTATKYDKAVYEYYKEIQPFSRLVKPFQTERNIWVIGEKPLEARNNGWYFFQYLRKNHPELTVYYVLDPTSPDFEKAVAFDKEHILPFKSKHYIRTLLMAQVILTSEAPYHIYPTRNPLWIDIIGAKRVLLQNNVLGLQPVKQSLGFASDQFKTDLFLVSSKIEKRYAIETLGYPEQQVALTGLARFDTLLTPDQKDAIKPEILIFPADQETGLHYQTEAIDRTAKRFLSLIKNPDFKRFLAEYELSVTVALPHSMVRYFSLFADCGCSVLLQEQANVLQLLKESKVFITDTDPHAFDFSFLTKPVCFYQPEVKGPDSENQISLREIYLNELPGEIASDEDSFIYYLTKLGQEGFEMSRKNRQKADALLEYRDTHSNERIYEAVQQLLPSRFTKK